MDGSADQFAGAYRAAVHAAAKAGISAEPEAQMTAPVPELLRAVAQDAGIGACVFLRETQLTVAIPGGRAESDASRTPTTNARAGDTIRR